MHPIQLRTIQTVEVEVEDEEDDTDEKNEEDDVEIKDDEDEPEEKPKKTKEVTTFEWELLNGNPAIWTRPKEEITEEEYQNFFKVVSGDEYSEASDYSHFNAEGNINFNASDKKGFAPCGQALVRVEVHRQGTGCSSN